MQTVKAIHPSAAAAWPDAQRNAFINVLAALLGLGDQNQLRAPDGVFATPSGLLFTLRFEQTDIGLLVRPEILMPMKAQDLGGPMVFRLLAVQSMLMREMNWWLSACSTGQLHLSPIQWHDQPATVAACIELAGALTTSIQTFIAAGEPAQSP